MIETARKTKAQEKDFGTIFLLIVAKKEITLFNRGTKCYLALPKSKNKEARNLIKKTFFLHKAVNENSSLYQMGK